MTLPNGNIFGDKKLQIIKVAGELNKATLEDGSPVYRSKTIFVDENIGVVACAPMDNHFVFRHVFNGRGWTLWCTCSSPAVVAGYEGYKMNASKGGELIVCYHHALYGKHADGSN